MNVAKKSGRSIASRFPVIDEPRWARTIDPQIKSLSRAFIAEFALVCMSAAKCVLACISGIKV
jgi:hypothetical protein